MEVDKSIGTLAWNIVRRRTKPGEKIDVSMIGEIKKKLNQRKNREVGKISPNFDVTRLHYDWVVSLNREIGMTGKTPTWL
jgi:hypothetical protein